MWILSIIYCFIHGHAFLDITTDKRPYQYCIRCGKVKEPVAVENQRLMQTQGIDIH